MKNIVMTGMNVKIFSAVYDDDDDDRDGEGEEKDGVEDDKEEEGEDKSDGDDDDGDVLKQDNVSNMLHKLYENKLKMHCFRHLSSISMYFISIPGHCFTHRQHRFLYHLPGVVYRVHLTFLVLTKRDQHYPMGLISTFED